MSHSEEANECTPLKGSIRTIRLNDWQEQSSSRHYSLSSLPPTTFATLTEELQAQHMKPDHATRQKIENRERRTLYGSLPFVAAFGMQKRETTMKKVISSASMHTLAKMQMDEEKQQFAMGESEVDMDEITITVHLMVAVAFAMVTEFLIGFNTSLLNVPPSHLPPHSLLAWSLAVSAFPFGGLVGSLLGGYLANRQGRRRALLYTSLLFFIGGLATLFSPSLLSLALSRGVVGLAGGMAYLTLPVYLGEIAPPTLRGSLATCTQFSVLLGLLASSLCVYSLSPSLSSLSSPHTTLLYSFTPLLSLLLLFTTPSLLESPRWLLNQSETSSQARRIIQKLRAFRTLREVEDEVQHYLFSMLKHKTAHRSAHSTAAVWDLLAGGESGVLLVAIVVLHLAQQCGGIYVVFFYSNLLLGGVGTGERGGESGEMEGRGESGREWTMAGIRSIEKSVAEGLGSIVISLCYLLSTYFSLYIIDHMPRRSLLLYSILGMLCSLLLVTAALSYSLSVLWVVGGLGAFVSCYALGLGPLPWLLVAEMVDTKYVATAMSVACVVNYLGSIAVAFTFPFSYTFLQSYCLLPYLSILCICSVFIFSYLPETQGRSVREVYRLVASSQGGRARGDTTLSDFEEKIVDMSIIDAVELLDES